jgi:hypothetical protein
MRRPLAQGRREVTYDWQLTDAEAAIARGLPNLPDRFAEELRERPADLLVRTTAMRKLRAYLEEERRLGEEVARYQGFKDVEEQVEVLQAQVASLRIERDAAVAGEKEARQRLRERTAEPALAANAASTR